MKREEFRFYQRQIEALRNAIPYTPKREAAVLRKRIEKLEQARDRELDKGNGVVL